jgi:hypothetical protein
MMSAFGCVARAEGFEMLDFFYIAIAVLFFFGLWAFTKACDRL